LKCFFKKKESFWITGVCSFETVSGLPLSNHLPSLLFFAGFSSRICRHFPIFKKLKNPILFTPPKNPQKSVFGDYDAVGVALAVLVCGEQVAAARDGEVDPAVAFLLAAEHGLLHRRPQHALATNEYDKLKSNKIELNRIKMMGVIICTCWPSISAMYSLLSRLSYCSRSFTLPVTLPPEPVSATLTSLPLPKSLPTNMTN